MHRQVRKAGLAAGICLLAILGLASPLAAVNRSSSAVKHGGTLYWANTSTWTTLDPGNAAASQAFMSTVGQFIYGHLFSETPNGQAVPQLALGSAYADHGLVETIQLRPGVKFTDGSPFNANAVVFNLDRDESSAGVGPASFVSLLTDIVSVKARGQYTVAITLKHPDYLLNQAFAVSLAGEIVSPAAVQSEGVTNFQLNPVGAGAYKVASDNASGGSLTLVRNPRYYVRGEPYLSGIDVSVVSSVQSGYAAVSSGSLSIYALAMYEPASYLQQAQSNPSLKIAKLPDITDYHLQLNIDKPPFDNPLAVQALDEATERLALINDVFPGTGAVADWSFQSPGGLYYTRNVPLPGEPPYNLQQAQSDVKTLGGLSFSIMAAASDSVTQEIQTALQKQWQLAGMNVQVQVLPHPTEIVDQEAGNYNVIEGGGQSYANPYFASYLFITSTAPNNAYGYKSSTVDGLLTRIEETPTTDTATLKKIWYQIDTVEADKGAFMGLFNGPIYEVEQSNLAGVTFAGSIIYTESAWFK